MDGEFADRGAGGLTLGPDDVLSHGAFVRVRPRLRPIVAAIRRRRRHPLGPYCTIVFENRETVLWQIQETMRVEGRTQPHHVYEELLRYDGLIPRRGELRATVLVEGGRADDADRFSERLVCDPEALELRVGHTSCFAECVDEHPELSSAVRYVRFAPERAGISAHALASQSVHLIARDPFCTSAPVADDLRQALATDLCVSQQSMPQDQPDRPHQDVRPLATG